MESNFSISKETSIIELNLCESDSNTDEDDIFNKSNESIASSDLIDSSDDEVEKIFECKKISY